MEKVWDTITTLKEHNMQDNDKFGLGSFICDKTPDTLNNIHKMYKYMIHFINDRNKNN